MPKKKFYFQFTITHTVPLDVDQIFPDGSTSDGEQLKRKITVKDVLKMVEQEGGPRKILSDWNLDATDKDINNIRLKVTARPQRRRKKGT